MVPRAAVCLLLAALLEGVEQGDDVEPPRREAAVCRERPTEDLTSELVHAEVDGQRLSDDDILQDPLLLGCCDSTEPPKPPGE